MILKSLILQGFKSFPERTVIRFHEGVTAVVGPNGSGKSNISDAIRWVLGEQSVKTLRANKMEELIFSGTETRRPLSYAEVTLTMDNSDRSLPLDYPEIRVSRRIYRSGESEYLINDSRCRLKDINELFLDTGIGRDGYSMIGQGRVDDILSGKAELRRKMLDEASGITKYKLRREEAEKKLAHTEQNLIRLNDILEEIEKQKVPLERQAKKARTFLELHEVLKTQDLALLYYEIDRKEEDSKRFQKDLEELTQTLQQADERKAKALAETAAQREAMQEISLRLNRLQTEEDAHKTEANQHEQNLALARQHLQQIAAKKIRYQTQSEELLERREELEREEKAKASEHESLNAQSEEAAKELSATDQTYSQAQRDRQATLLLQQTLTEDETQNREQLQQVQQLIRDESTTWEVLKNHREMLLKDLAQVDSELDNETSKADELTSQLDKIQSDLKNQREQNSQLERTRETQRLELAEAEQAYRQTEQTLNNLKYQIQTQTELAESYEGYGYSVKQLMDWSRDRESAVYGPLADLLQVPEEYEAAIESVLGGTAQHIVVQDESIASRLIQTLKDKRWGRATFLPLNRVSQRTPDPAQLRKISTMPGYLGIAAELVDYKPEVKNAVLYALGQTVVASTLALALEMAKAVSFRVRIVSLEGDLLNPGGSMSGGSRKQQQSGILSRQRLLDELKQRISTTDTALAEKAELKEEISRQMAELEARTAELGSEIAALAREEIVLGSHRKQYEQNRIRLQSKSEQNQSDITRLEKEAEDQATALEKRRREEQEVQEKLSLILKQRSEIQAQLETQSLKVSEFSDLRAEQNLKLTRFKERASTAMQLLLRVRQELAQVREELDVQVMDQEEDKLEENRLNQLLLNGETVKQELETALKQVQEQIRKAEGERQHLNTIVEDNMLEMEQVSGLLSKLGQDQGRLEQRIENSQSQLMDLRSRLWEEYNYTFANREQWYQPDLNITEVRDEVKTLRQKIRDLGAVNVQAIEESRELIGRFEFMNGQKEDIVSAQNDLHKVIADITQEMHKQFQESFKYISEQFRQVFRELFGGGEAELVLEDSNDILNSPIDIRAMPPGKRLQNMLALSGGERCLTAIALLFAIQKLNPSPFCVLDEVEAALDESNVFRFTDYVKANAAGTQYILVTHRRGTMEAARMIYGITMQERGISQVISVRLEE